MGFLRRKKEEEKKPKLSSVTSFAMVTTEATLSLESCKVFDDHKMELGSIRSRNKKKVDIKEDRPAHILEIPLKKLIPNRLSRFLAPRAPQRYLVYTVQKTGEMTHDPHQDGYPPEQKVNLENVLKLKAAAAKAEIAAQIMAGLKGKGSWWETLGWGLIICAIVFLFLFAFQIQPNM